MENKQTPPKTGHGLSIRCRMGPAGGMKVSERLDCQLWIYGKCVMGRFANKKQRASLFLLQDGKCALCPVPLPDDFHADHIQPVVLKGPTEIWNLQALCVDCHRRKTSFDGSRRRDTNRGSARERFGTS